MNQNKLFIATILIAFLLMISLAFGQQDTTLSVTSNGYVGIGTSNPEHLLDIHNHAGRACARIRGGGQELGSTRAELILDRVSQARGAGIRIQNNADPALNKEWWIGVPYNSGVASDFFTIGRHSNQPEYKANAFVTITNTGNVGIGTTDPSGKLDVNGSIYQRGSLLHADYVFESDYKLESIEEHANFMWKNKHLKAIPKAKVDENGKEIVEVGAHRKGIVEELEKAHIYIDQLHNRIKTLEETLEKLAIKLNTDN